MPPKKVAGKPGRPPKAPVVEPKVPQSSPMTQAVMDAMLAFGEKLQAVSNDTIADLQELHGDFLALHGMVMGNNGTAPAVRVPTSRAPDPEPEPEPEPDINFEDMSVGDLQDVIDEYSLDVDLASIKGLAAKQAAVEDAYLDRGNGNTVTAEEPTMPAPDFAEMTKKELQEFIDEHDLDVDLAAYKRLAEMQEAVEMAYGGAAVGEDDDSNDWPEN